MMNNLPFQIPISSLKYYYGTKLIGFAYENSLSIMIRIPLTYAGGIFKLYKINTIKLPLPVKAIKDGVQKYAKLSGNPDYFAISYDEEYYMEMTHTELINCKGLDECLKVCNPVKIMESVRDKPSCGLTIYKGDAVMMKTYCKRILWTKTTGQSGVSIRWYIWIINYSPQGHFIQHCNNAGQMITIKLCKLCIIKLPCNCILRTSTGMVPPLMNQCKRNLLLKTNSTIRYPVNLLVLSQMLNDTELGWIRGLFLKTVPHIPECTKERCGYKWQKAPEAINGSKTKMFLGQQFPARIGSKTNEENEDEIYYEYWEKSASIKIRKLKQALRKSNKKLKGKKRGKMPEKEK